MSIILITGGNRGIGFAIVEAVGSRMPDATIFMGCRSTASAIEPMKMLKEKGIQANIEPIEITITDDSSIRAAVKSVEEKCGRLDVLVNNAAAIAMPKSQELGDVRANWAEGLDCLLTSPVLVTKAFIPLLRKSDWGRVIMNSSSRGSLTRNIGTDLPPSVHWLYDCSKAALNLATIEFRNDELRKVDQERDRITFWAANPGHCKTGFNNFRGLKDPLEGAEVTVRLLESRRGEVPSGTFWEFEQGSFQQVPW